MSGDGRALPVPTLVAGARGWRCCLRWSALALMVSGMMRAPLVPLQCARLRGRRVRLRQHQKAQPLAHQDPAARQGLHRGRSGGRCCRRPHVIGCRPARPPHGLPLLPPRLLRVPLRAPAPAVIPPSLRVAPPVLEGIMGWWAVPACLTRLACRRCQRRGECLACPPGLESAVSSGHPRRVPRQAPLVCVGRRGPWISCRQKIWMDRWPSLPQFTRTHRRCDTSSAQ